jgi:hypothetical protein
VVKVVEVKEVQMAVVQNMVEVVVRVIMQLHQRVRVDFGEAVLCMEREVVVVAEV